MRTQGICEQTTRIFLSSLFFYTNDMNFSPRLGFVQTCFSKRQKPFCRLTFFARVHFSKRRENSCRLSVFTQTTETFLSFGYVDLDKKSPATGHYTPKGLCWAIGWRNSNVGPDLPRDCMVNFDGRHFSYSEADRPTDRPIYNFFCQRQGRVLYLLK
jgi:hypothetical protein